MRKIVFAVLAAVLLAAGTVASTVAVAGEVSHGYMGDV